MDKKVKHEQRKDHTNNVDNLQQSFKPNHQLGSRLKILIIYVYIPIIILLGVVAATGALTGIPLGFFTRDPASILGEQKIAPLLGFEVNPFIGIISNLGVLLWCVSASIYLFVFLLEALDKQQKRGQKSSFMLLMGLFSLMLMFDDLFLFHEIIAPKLVVHEEVIYACYMAFFIYLIVKFARIFLSTDILSLCLAFLFFFLSLAIDFVHFPSIILEDGFKLLGIASWASYSVIVGAQFVSNIRNNNYN